MGKNNCYVADFGYNGIGAVGSALPETAWMNMHVCDNDTPGLPTMLPEIAKTAAIDNHAACPQRIRIDIVIENELLDLPHPVVGAQQKGAALAPTSGTAPQFGDALAPNRSATQNLRPTT